MKIKVAQFGLGPIGIETLRLAATKPWVEIVGGIDIDPQKNGRSLTEVTGIKGLESARVYSSAEQLPVKPDVALHTTVSKFQAALPQLQSLARAGISVVSSCEELLFPQLKDPAGAAALDALCQQHGARMLGTGVNPGFVMDVLPVCLTGVCRSVGKIEVTRVVNASSRRLPLQKKIGSGLDPEEFRRLFRAGKMGHVGLVESLALVAHCMNWPIGPIKETCEPVIATEDIKTEFLEVKKGLTCGIHHRAEAAVHGQTVIELDLQMYLNAINPRDVVRVAGDPTIEMVETGGIQGDRATVAALVNAVPRLLKAPPGLRLMTDLSVPCVS